MLSRIRAAWSVLRGTHKAVPMEANWYVYKTGLQTFGYNDTSATTLYWNQTG